MSRRTISSDGQREFFHAPTCIYNQMLSFYSMRDELLSEINKNISESKLHIDWDDLTLKNEFIFFNLYKFVGQNTKWEYNANFGNYALRFNICIDRLLTLFGHDFLIKRGFYDADNLKKYEGHPLIMNYGPKPHDNFSSHTICIDRDADYSFYNNSTPKNPIVIDTFIDESQFKKEIIKRSLHGYFYKDMNSCGIFQAFNRNPVGSIDVTILIFLFNFVSILDIFSHLIDFIFNLDMSSKINKTAKTNGKRLSWAYMESVIDELKQKGDYSLMLAEELTAHSNKINKASIPITHARNVIMHQGNILISLIKVEKQRIKKGIYITIEKDVEKLMDLNGTPYFDVIPFVAKNYSILIKMFSSFYALLFKAVENGETIFHHTIIEE